MPHTMHARMVLFFAMTACSYPPLPRLNDAPAEDGTGGGAAQNGPVCFGTQIRVCFPTAPTADLEVLAAQDIDTDAEVGACDLQNDQSTHYCVIAANSIKIDSGIRIFAHGSKPLLLLSATTIASQGGIDVSSSRQSSTPGAGADPADCLATMPAVGSGGGQGGSFGGKGGNGSNGSPVDGSRGFAEPALTAAPTRLRGGCPGGSAASLGPNGEGSGGHGGGAVALIAAQIQLDGDINASGSGGRGGMTTKSGGGGGGSGGMIVLDAPTITLVSTKANAWANGGGGGEGGGSGDAGLDGIESMAPQFAGVGSSGTGAGANGGDGSVGSTTNGGDGKTDALTGGGGGGGGGGAGIIIARAVMSTTEISPAATQ